MSSNGKEVFNDSLRWLREYWFLLAAIAGAAVFQVRANERIELRLQTHIEEFREFKSEVKAGVSDRYYGHQGRELEDRVRRLETMHLQERQP